MSLEDHMNQALAAMEARDADAALAALDAALTLDPAFIPALGMRGSVLGGIGNYPAALACFDALIELEPDVGGAHYERGLHLTALGRTDEAIEAYTQAIALSPEDPDPLINRGTLLDEDDEPEQAIADYDRALALNDQEDIAWCNRGNSLCALERFEEAVASYDRALAIDPEHHGAMAGRSTALMSLGRLADADVARPLGTPYDRGPVQELRKPLKSGDDLVMRWYPGGHTHPEWLQSIAESVMDFVASCEDTPPGLADDITIAFGWSMLTIRHRGSDRILCEPAFLSHPLSQLNYDASFSLQVAVMMDAIESMVEEPAVEVTFTDGIAIAYGAIWEDDLVLHRLHEREDEMSGWIAGPETLEAVEALLESEAYDIVPTAVLAKHRPHLIKVLGLPPGFRVTFAGHHVVAIVDGEGTERFRDDGEG